MSRWAMIMAGGSGTRLWPLSRESRPKQLIPLATASAAGRSLLQLAGDRLGGIIAADHRTVCASSKHEQAIRAALAWLNSENFLGEPTGRDTLAAVGFTAAVLAARDENAVFAVVPSDHLIEPQGEFARAMEVGFRLVEAQSNRIVTFSIKPTFPATGYGYVELMEPIAGFHGAFRTGRFVEKPDLDRATEYLKSGRFGWNSGMFIFHARTVLTLIARFHPEMGRGLEQIGHSWGTPTGRAQLEAIYPTLTRISVDFGLMEPASRDSSVTVCAVPMEVDWRDVGSWPTYCQSMACDADENRSNAPSIQLGSLKSSIISDDPSHFIATIGVENLVIVHTADATLICRADQSEKVKEIAGRVPVQLR